MEFFKGPAATVTLDPRNQKKVLLMVGGRVVARMEGGLSQDLGALLTKFGKMAEEHEKGALIHRPIMVRAAKP